MFHTNQFITNQAFPYEKTVIEKRAPTDESIKLWDEMLDKARKGLIKDINLNDNKINLRAGLFENPRSLYSNELYYWLTINGVAFNSKIKISTLEKNPKVLHQKIIEDLSKDLAKNLLKLL